MRINLVEYTYDYLNHSWRWLNDAEIRKLTNTSIFTIDNQKKWFYSLHEKKNYKIWGIELHNNPIGACGLKNISDSDCEYWGYIGEKQYWGIGLGKEIMTLIEEKAYGLGIRSVWLKVIKENIRAISLYKKQGYVVESQTDVLLFMRKHI